MEHIPKGSMCAACRYRTEECPYNFSSMPVLTVYAEEDGTVVNIVRCTEFVRSKDDKSVQT
jgi:hypothetical protein